MTRQERTAVRDLQERQDFVILTADKGNATVIMDQADYKKKIEDLLEDPVHVLEDLEGSNQCNREEDNQRTEGSGTEEAHFEGPDEQT